MRTQINLRLETRIIVSQMATFNSNLTRLKINANKLLMYFPSEVSNSFRGILRLAPILITLSTFQPSVSDFYVIYE